MLDLNELSALLANVATFLGIPLAVVILWLESRKSRRERELGTYLELQQEYISFLNLCFDNSELGLLNYEAPDSAQLDGEQRRKRQIAYEILVSILESAFFQYHYKQRSGFRKRQWTGWEEYVDYWVGVDSFRAAWQAHLGSQYDSDFVRFMNDKIERRAHLPMTLSA